MIIKDSRIDSGNPFDFGRTAYDYAKYRDIYPAEFYHKIIARNLCINSQRVLDLGTGTGVIPRNMYHYGADWTGTDISEAQIEQAIKLSKASNMDIKYEAVPTEKINYPDNTFDVITACQCFWYFDHKVVMPKLARMIKSDGRLLLLYMAWLPFEDKIAGESEKLILKYNPKWSGARETKHPIDIPKCAYDTFELIYHEEYNLNVPFTKETWHGRMKACRGIGASLNPDEITEWENEHLNLLDKIAPERFDILHYAAIVELRPKK